MENAEGNLETTIKASREFMSQMTWVRSSLNLSEQILKALKEVLPSRTLIEDSIESKNGGDCHALQSKVWNDNLLRQITFIRNRLNDIIERQQGSESTVGKLPPCSIKGAKRNRCYRILLSVTVEP